MSNPLCPLLICAMCCCTLVVLYVLHIIKKALVHFMEKDADGNFLRKGKE